MKTCPLYLLLLLPFIIYGQEPYVQVIASEKGLGNSPISMIIEDHRGILWAATQLGLIRFDGLEAKVHLPEKGNPNSIPHEMVNDLFEDSEGFIWLATRNGLSSLDPSRKIFKRYFMDSADESTIPNNRIYSLLRDTDSTFFLICDQSGLASFNTKSKKVTRHNPTIQSEREVARVQYVLRTLNHKVLVGTGQGLYEYNRQKNILEKIIDPGTGYAAIAGKRNYYSDGRGVIWFADQMGYLYQWIPNESLVRIEDVEVCNVIQKSSAIRYYDYNADHVLIATLHDNFLIHKRTGKASRLLIREDQETLLYDDPVQAVTEISNGIIAMGSFKGNFYLINPLLQKFKYRQIAPSVYPKVEHTTINDIFEDHQFQKRYISANLDSVIYVEDMRTKEIKAYPRGRRSIISDRFYLSHDGRLWACNESDIIEIDRTDQSFKHHIPQIPVALLFEMVEVSPGRMLIGSFQEGLYWFEPDQHHFEKIPETKGWIRTQVFGLKYDQKHHSVWIGTVRNGLFRYDIVADTFVQYNYDSRNPHSLGGDWVRDIAIDSLGYVWFSTDPIGLSRFDYNAHPDSAFISLSVEDGLPSNFISGLVTDQKGQLWMSSLNGIASLNPDNLAVKIYRKEDGLSFTRYYQGLLNITKDGRILTGAANGYFYFHPDSIYINHHAPEIVISDIRIFDQSMMKLQDRVKDPLVLSYKENYLTILFSVINYTKSQFNKVRYILDGFDNSWHEATGINQVSYTKIPPGDYTFRIMAANNDGVWNEVETLIPIMIKPPFWQRTWFYLFIGAVMASAVGMLYRYKLQQTVRENNLVMEKEKMRSEAETQMARLEMTALRAQMNPHFIFNCLNSINRFIIVNDNDTASEYLTKFAKLIRQVLDNSRGEKVTLSNELETLKLYIEMESLRFFDKFDFTLDIDTELHLEKYLIQPMLIQPYVENAIWHGLMHRKEKGELYLNFTRKENSVIVDIKDNGVGRARSKEISDNQVITRKSHGMKVTAQRMSLLSKKLNARVEAIVADILDQDQHVAGTHVKLILPLEEMPVVMDRSLEVQ